MERCQVLAAHVSLCRGSVRFAAQTGNRDIPRTAFASIALESVVHVVDGHLVSSVPVHLEHRDDVPMQSCGKLVATQSTIQRLFSFDGKIIVRFQHILSRQVDSN